MKRNEIKQLKNKTRQELLNDFKKHQERLWKIKVDLAAGKVKNIGEIKELKKMIARIYTIFNNNQMYEKK